MLSEFDMIQLEMVCVCVCVSLPLNKKTVKWHTYKILSYKLNLLNDRFPVIT